MEPTDYSPRRGTRKLRKPRNWSDVVTRPEPYDPLALTNLGRSVELALLGTEPVPIISVPPTVGAGVYAIYYAGNHPLYAPISSNKCEIPIYVGKAVPQGGRKGLVDESKDTSTLWDRIDEHRESLEQARDLHVQDFFVRYLVAVEIFVPLTERVMIRQLHPVWNLRLDGFGNHDPGARRRREGQRPAWDEVHPGRWWSTPENMPTPSSMSVEKLTLGIRAHFDALAKKSMNIAAPTILDTDDSDDLFNTTYSDEDEG